MQVTINYPDTFPLDGWAKLIFNYRLEKMFRGKWVSICTIDALRAQISKEETDFPDTDKVLREDLEALHCESFKKLDKAILKELPAKVGQFLGIEITPINMLTRRYWPIKAIIIVGILVILAFFVTVMMISNMNERQVKYSTSSTHGDALVAFTQPVGVMLKSEYLPSDSVPTGTYVEPSQRFCAGDEFLCVTGHTAKPDEFIKKISIALPRTGGKVRRYAVLVKVIAHEDDAIEASN